MRTIALTQGKVAIVDDEDFEWLSQWKWTYRWKKANYGIAVFKRWQHGRQVTYKMHRMIAGAQPGEIVDHKNGNPLDNRRCNLRICTIQENLRNRTRKKPDCSSRFKGVHRSGNRWIAQIRVSGRGFHLGSFVEEEDAALMYDVACQIIYGEFGCPNGV